MAVWNSFPLEIAYQVLGWTAFVSWSVSFYPQLILNYSRKSVVGLNFDFVVLNLTKHSAYLIHNAALYFSKVVQKQYFEKYGFGQMIPVAANDVAFSIHAVLVTAFALFQISIYERGGQTISRISFAIVAAAWSAAAICFFMALSSQSWLWLVSVFKIECHTAAASGIAFDKFSTTRVLDFIKVSLFVLIAAHDYVNQVFMEYQLNSSVNDAHQIHPAGIMNFRRKSTDGFSIGYVTLDFIGSSANFAQMAMQSIDQHTLVNFYGNTGKTLLSLICLSFDILFIVQHYILYPTRLPPIFPPESLIKEPLIESDGTKVSGNV